VSGPGIAQQPEPSGELATLLKREATRLGFGLVGIVAAEAMDQYAGIEVPYWQARGSTGRPADVMPDVRSIVALGLHVWDPVLDVAAYDTARAEWVYPAYAVMEQRKEKLAQWLTRRGFNVHSGPAKVSYKRLAVLAGFGDFGKNSLIVNDRYGSNFRLACLLTDAELEADQPTGKDPCGKCTLCLSACPMDALQPWRVDPEACLVGLSLRERAGDILEVAPGIRQRLAALDRPTLEPRFSPNVHLMCRACQDICPHSRTAPTV